MHMTTFSSANDEKYSNYDNRSKANSDGKIFYLSSLTNDLNQVDQDNNNSYNLSRIDRYETSCASTSRLVNNYEIIPNESIYTTNNYSTPSGKLSFNFFNI
jgi:hypothetical protein